ncbi:hypothetical protein B0A48_00985 [Cryoendolithus antarcticus]|uniref:Uncharacterized protein n=1 Tax=Cryoendolithus antarcticus TaxID=1507870 RepID=A0A1V8TRX5_9PEZI|nr:hypothetical protein B0A48_00985 [Cryoendolithus antarcticus]
MGLPQATTPPTTPPTSTSAPKSRPTLPPKALDLATKLFNSARTGDTPLLAQYITAGIPPNLTNSSGDTLLMLASYHNHLPTVEMLIEKGADVDAVNDRGQSILAGAVFKGYEEVVEVLVRAGAGLKVGKPTAVETAVLFRREGMLDGWGVGEEERREVRRVVEQIGRS